MNSRFSERAVEAVCEIIEKHADRGGVANAARAWRDLLDLPLDVEAVQEIVNRLQRTGYLWLWGEWIILPRPVRCPECNQWFEVRLSRHMHEDHPRPTAQIAWLEWAD